MKLKNNSIAPKVIHYVSNKGGRKSITIETNSFVDIDDCERIINEIEIQNKWVSVVEKEQEISKVDKLEKAAKDVESYISETVVEQVKKAQTKKIK